MRLVSQNRFGGPGEVSPAHPPSPLLVGLGRGCFTCGNTAHTPSHCSFKGAPCYNCGKVGYIRKTCRKPKYPPCWGWRSGVTERQECESCPGARGGTGLYSKWVPPIWYQRVCTWNIGLTGNCRSARHSWAPIQENHWVSLGCLSSRCSITESLLALVCVEGRGHELVWP